jgi:D-psicose/D-tagatose/L-ribulose 3-epimerase
MAIRFGVNTWVWTAPFNNEAVKLFPKIKKMGFDGVELPVEDPSLFDVKTIQDGLKKAKLPVLSVCGAFGPDRDLSHDDPKVQENCLAYLKVCIDCAAAWGAPVVAGPMYSSVGKARLVPADQKKAEWGRAVANLKKAAAMAASAGVRLAIEPLNRFEIDLVNIAEQAVQMIKDVGNKALGIHLDTFHMNIEEKDVAEAVKAAGKNLYHLHACENDRGAPGSGQVRWKAWAKAVKAAKYDGAVVIESFTPEVTSIAKAAAIWRKLAPSQDRLATDGLKFLKKLLKKDE